MKLYELLEQLNKYDSNLEVVISKASSDGSESPIIGVSYRNTNPNTTYTQFPGPHIAIGILK